MQTFVDWRVRARPTVSIPKQGYKVFFTTNPNQPEASWDSQMVDNSELTTISELTPLAIYTVRVQAYTSMGPGPMSNPVKVKTQQGELSYAHSVHRALRGRCGYGVGTVWAAAEAMNGSSIALLHCGAHLPFRIESQFSECNCSAPHTHTHAPTPQTHMRTIEMRCPIYENNNIA